MGSGDFGYFSVQYRNKTTGINIFFNKKLSFFCNSLKNLLYFIMKGVQGSTLKINNNKNIF